MKSAFSEVDFTLYAGGQIAYSLVDQKKLLRGEIRCIALWDVGAKKILLFAPLWMAYALSYPVTEQWIRLEPEVYQIHLDGFIIGVDTDDVLAIHSLSTGNLLRFYPPGSSEALDRSKVQNHPR